MKNLRKVVILTAIIIMSISAVVSAATTLATDVTKASSGCVLVNLKGQYLIEADKVLARMNQIRLEACVQGVKNPTTGKPLTKKDYVPLKWSSDMEYIAKIRAAESTITMDHIRTNGKSCFALKSPKGKVSGCEIIAWNFGKDATHGIEQWYAEKNSYVKRTGGVTGHYEAMIDPVFHYVGMASFYSEKTLYYNSTVAQFSTAKSGQSTTKGKTTGTVIQRLEVKTSIYNKNRSRFEGVVAAPKKPAPTLTVNAVKIIMKKGKKATIVAKKKNTTAKITFASSNKKVATVTSKGVVKGVKKGTAVITVKAGSLKKTVRITVK